MFFLLLQNSRKVVPLHRVFHSIRFKVNKGWAQRSPFFYVHIPILAYFGGAVEI